MFDELERSRKSIIESEVQTDGDIEAKGPIV
jgi:hypothetical protein